MIKKIKIGKHLVGNGLPPFIIAEMSTGGGSLKRALKIVDSVAKAGAHAVKLQTYTADTITLKSNRREFVINDKKAFGMVEIYMISMTKHILHGSGTRDF